MLASKEMRSIRSFLLRIEGSWILSKSLLCFGFVFISSVVAPEGWARLGPQYQMALGNPDGASTNPASRTKFLINQRAQYAISYNDDTHQPNWVSWSYSLADDGTQARTDAWATEELLPSGYLKIGTATFGTGWDRGHMCPSADRTKDLTNNQVTFRMSNIIPQASQNNQGLWANFEDYCRTLAADGDEVLIICGPAQFTGSRLNNQMSIPGSVWKIAVEISNATSTTPANQRITTSARVIALLTPNTSTGLGPWQSYVTSVEAIEGVTGFNFFTAITNAETAIYLKNLVDTGTGPNKPTVITTFSPKIGAVGTPVTISGFNFVSPTVTFNGTPTAVISSTSNSITVNVPTGAASGFIEVQGANGADTSYEAFTVTTGSAPILSLAPSSLSGLTAREGSAGTASLYALTGSQLTENVSVSVASADSTKFEISANGLNYSNTLTLVPGSTGSLSSQLYVRIKAGAPVGAISGSVSHVSGTGSANLLVAGTVASTAPNLSVSTNSITAFSAPQNSAGTSKSYTVSGSNLTGSVNVSATAGFEVSTDNTTFARSVSLAPTTGALSNVPVYVRLAASGTVGPVSGTITHSGGGAAPVDVSVSGDITSTAPSLVLSTNSISGFTAVQNNPGGSKTYTVTGTFLTSGITIGAPSGFEVGTNATVFTNSLVLSPSSGTLPTTTIYARLASSATTGGKSGNITHTGGGVGQQGINVTGTVNAPTAGETWIATSGINTKGLINTNQSLGSKTGVWLNEFHYDTAGIDTNEFVEVVVAPDVSNSLSEISVVLYNGNNLSAYSTNFLSGFTLGSTVNGYRFLSLTYLSNGIQNGGTPTPEPDGIAVVVAGVAVQFLSYEGVFTAANGPAAGMTSTDIGVAESGAPVGSSLQLTGSGGSVAPKPVITSATTAMGTANSPLSYQITASNTPTYFSASGLPAGLGVDNTTGVISGTPTTAGTYSVLLAAGNASGDGTATLVITIHPQPAPGITSSATASATVNVSFQYQITASNSPTSFGATGLPPGMSVDGNGLISGTPTAAGSYIVALSASNAGGTGTANLALMVDPDPNVPVISGPFTATAAVGNSFLFLITASNNPLAYLASGLPEGLSLDPMTGVISGTPAASGTTPVLITASNASGTDTKTLTITVLAPALEVSAMELNFSGVFGQPSVAQTYDLTGSDLGGAITVLAPGNFEINDNGGTTYFDELTIAPQSDGTINSTIHVRLKASAPLGESTGSIINSGAKALPKYVNLTGFSDVAAATIDLSVWSLTGFSTKTGTPSLTQSYTVSGVGLTEPVTLTAPTGFQISSNNNSFSATLTLTPDGTGRINAQEIFVRLSSATAGTFSGLIEHVGGGTTETKSLAVSGTVIAPVGPPIISPLSGSAYTSASFRTRVLVGGSLAATSFGGSGLPGTLQINQTNGIVSGNAPSTAGTNVFSLSASTQDGTTTNSYSLRVVNSTEQASVPTSVVVNKFQNGLPDRVELLVVGNTNDAAPGPPVDMRGMVLKDFSANRTADDGGEFRFTDHPLWSRVPAGTLIVLSAGTQSTEDTDPADFVLRVNLGNATLMKQETPGFDIDDLEMILIKPATMGVEGFAGGIHALAAGKVSGTTIYALYTGKKIRSDQSLNTSRDTVYATASSLSGYNSAEDKSALTASGLEFGVGNTSANRSYITSLRGLDQTPPVVTLNGSATINLTVGQTYTELGAVVSGGTSSTPTITGAPINPLVAGTYAVVYSGTDSSGNVGTATRTVIVAKATPLITQSPSASAIIAGQRLFASQLTGGTASVPGTFAWSEPSTRVLNSGAGSYPVTFTPSDAANYNSTTAMVSVTASQGTPFQTWITDFSLTGADALEGADPDRDGLNNLLEFDLGRSPTRGDGWARSVAVTGNQLKVTFLQRIGTELAVQTSANLVTGFNGTVTPAKTDPQPNDVPADYEQYEAVVNGLNGRAFLRILSVQP